MEQQFSPGSLVSLTQIKRRSVGRAVLKKLQEFLCMGHVAPQAVEKAAQHVSDRFGRHARPSFGQRHQLLLHLLGKAKVGAGWPEP